MFWRKAETRQDPNWPALLHAESLVKPPAALPVCFVSFRFLLANNTTALLSLTCCPLLVRSMGGIAETSLRPSEFQSAHWLVHDDFGGTRHSPPYTVMRLALLFDSLSTTLTSSFSSTCVILAGLWSVSSMPHKTLILQADTNQAHIPRIFGP